MADDDGAPSLGAENDALGVALEAVHAAVWGYGVVGAALDAGARGPVSTAEAAHRDVRDRVTAVLTGRDEKPPPAEGAYALPFPVLSAVDAAALAVVLEEGAATAWVRVLDQASERSTRELALEALSGTEVRAVGWRAAAGRTPVTRALPGLPAD
ncbi:ferritin-like domain-containing protein [Candidatus Blastococcus massiliensis]|uniref:ferritin-like domain-containing protein n=1 Tax=Candidatus Blastococcus massiliensis TaxID=1470358 RepID=UPI0004B9C575|nr:ferritin-like domain-containing protein [Candidatus Blastococcus massiliensis]